MANRSSGPRRSPIIPARPTSALAAGPNSTAASTIGMNTTDSSSFGVNGMLRPSAIKATPASTRSTCHLPTPSVGMETARHPAASAVTSAAYTRMVVKLLTPIKPHAVNT